MKKLMISMMMVVFMLMSDGMVSANNADARKSDKPHFRGAYWGTSIEEVKKALKEKDEIVWESGTQIGLINPNLSYDITYFFIDNKLTNGMFMYNKSHVNANFYLDEYYKMQSILIEKYGAPELNENIWNNDLYKDDVQHYGLAISVGHLSCLSNWVIHEDNPIIEKSDKQAQKGDLGPPALTNIILRIHGDNFEEKLVLIYNSTEYYHLFEENEKKKNERNF